MYTGKSPVLPAASKNVNETHLINLDFNLKRVFWNTQDACVFAGPC